ncbi:hypothetical protein [Kitasatospora sp. NPDC096140]|uniref:hypothetical protein n=1 Tax=unclassified Kitasatospora TaxID=2633591 RepID=UPI003328F64D
MKSFGKISAMCAAVAAAALLGAPAAHAQGDGGLLGLGLLNTPALTVACIPGGLVSQGSPSTGNQNTGCSQSASGAEATPSSSAGGLPARQTVSSSVAAQPGELATASARCPAGTVVTGGGLATDAGSSWDIKSSAATGTADPSTGGAWSASAKNTGTAPQMLTVHAVCAGRAA